SARAAVFDELQLPEVRQHRNAAVPAAAGEHPPHARLRSVSRPHLPAAVQPERRAPPFRSGPVSWGRLERALRDQRGSQPVRQPELPVRGPRQRHRSLLAMSPRKLILAGLLTSLMALGIPAAMAAEHAAGPAEHSEGAPPAPLQQTAAEAQRKSAGCMSCHTTVDAINMHTSPGVTLGCADCHGGKAEVFVAPGVQPGSREYRAALDAAHVKPRYPEAWNYPSSAKPARTYVLLNKESPEFVRFLNPSDYRVARQACGACHMPVIAAAERSLMATTAMFWAMGAYNNGILPFKHSILGEAYTPEGEAAK